MSYYYDYHCYLPNGALSYMSRGVSSHHYTPSAQPSVHTSAQQHPSSGASHHPPKSSKSQTLSSQRSRQHSFSLSNSSPSPLLQTLPQFMFSTPLFLHSRWHLSCASISIGLSVSFLTGTPDYLTSPHESLPWLLLTYKITE